MKYLLITIFTFFINISLSAEISSENFEKLFNVGTMKSHDNEFTLYFKSRKKSILARGVRENYIKDYPQDLYIYFHKTKSDLPLISYEWFPKEAKKITNFNTYPVFPEEFAYYLLQDNNTLVMINAKKQFKKNFEFNIRERKLTLREDKNKIDFIISTFAKNCGYKNIKENYNCYFYKPLVSSYLFN